LNDEKGSAGREILLSSLFRCNSVSMNAEEIIGDNMKGKSHDLGCIYYVHVSRVSCLGYSDLNVNIVNTSITHPCQL
jgi:hypothetical protein